jgi:hypothetical protein
LVVHEKKGNYPLLFLSLRMILYLHSGYLLFLTLEEENTIC